MYPVRTEPSALGDVARHYRYLQENDPSSGYADEWFEAIQEAILSLGELPLRFGLAPENDAFEEEYGTGSSARTGSSSPFTNGSRYLTHAGTLPVGGAPFSLIPGPTLSAAASLPPPGTTPPPSRATAVPLRLASSPESH